VGNFRILFRIDDAKKIVEIARVLDRKEAYRAL
jgi:mRNA-degrading endonuclease RelE of RelBE toxin-antitoxin system